MAKAVTSLNQAPNNWVEYAFGSDLASRSAAHPRRYAALLICRRLLSEHDACGLRKSMGVK